MKGTIRMAAIGVMVWAAAGCGTTREARYVYQDGQFGVVGIPKNTTHWPTNYRAQAEELMAAHFPEGYEIVRAEEVVEGSRTLTVGGTRTTEILPEVAAPAIKIGKFGLSKTTNQADTLKIKECRIIYKRAAAPNSSSPAFAASTTLAPTLYLDPNAIERRHEVAKPVDGKAKADGEKPDAEKVEKDKSDAPGVKV